MNGEYADSRRGMAMVALAVLLGLALVGVLYQWDQGLRLPAGGAPTPAPALAAPSIAGLGGKALPAATSPVASGASSPGTKVEAGRVVYGRFCEACHPGGGAGVGSPLRGEAFQRSYASDAALTEVIRQGKAGMPGYGPDQIDPGALTALVAYIRSLR